MTENRQHKRDEVDELAYISIQGSSISCVVRNISAGGAAIDVAEPTEVPSKFKLMLQSDRQSFECQVVWIKSNRMGVIFVGGSE